MSDPLLHLLPALAQQPAAGLIAGLDPEPGLPVEFWRTYWISVSVLFGLLWGSFLNVCIYRVPAGLSVVAPRSYCYTCGTMVAARDNVPVLSWLLLGGCCRHCGTRLSARYAAIELLTGLLFGAIAWRFLADGQPTGAMVAYMVFAGFLIVATFTDIDHFIIPDGVSLGSGAAGIAAAGLAGAAGQLGLLESGLIPPIGRGWPFEALPVLGAGGAIGAMANAALGGIFAAGMLKMVGVIGSIIFRKEAMGMGDVKLMVGIGAFLGVVHSVVAFFVACVLGAVISLSWMGAQWLSGRRTRMLGDRFPAAGGVIQEAFDAELARLREGGSKRPAEGLAAASAAPASEAAALAAVEQADPDRADAEAAAPPATTEQQTEAAEAPWSRAALGRRLAEAAAGPRPHHFRHLPFGPYLALGAMIVLFAHASITREANLILELFDLRENVPFQVRYIDESGREVSLPAPLPDLSSHAARR